MSHKYTFQDQPPILAQEPEATYLSPMNSVSFFSSLSAYDMADIEMPGNALSVIQEQTDLPAQLIAEVVGISKSKYYDLLQQDHLDIKIIDALADFSVLWQQGLEAFDNERSFLLEWLHTRNENLGGILPISLMGSRTGRRALEKAFLRIEYSVYG